MNDPPELRSGKLALYEDNDVWIQGEPSNAWLDIDYNCAPDDFQCPRTEITVEKLTCNGCTILESPVGNAAVLKPSMRIVAAVDGPFTLDADVREADTGFARHLSSTLTGDHEIGLAARCALIDSGALEEGLMHGGGLSFRTCDTPRSPGDSVVIFPVIETSGGRERFPFCDPDLSCTSWDGKQLRPRSTLVIDPAPVTWARSYSSDFYGDFAVMPQVVSARIASHR